MSNNNIKKCSKCNIAYDQDLGSVVPNEVEKQCRIFNKNGKCFCFNCLASEYNVNCQYCHKRINSKDEVWYWSGGVLSIGGDYDYCKADDRVFTCSGCGEKIRELLKNGVNPSWHSGWGPILFPEHNIRKCRIVGCSQKPYYEHADLCLPHSKPCKGGKIRPDDGKICSQVRGSDEGDICEFCQNQKGTNEVNHTNKDNSPTSISTPNLSNSPNPNQAKDKSSDVKIELERVKKDNSETKNQTNETLIINLNEVKQITLTSEGNLVIEFNSSQSEPQANSVQVITAGQIATNSELVRVKDYCQRTSKNSLGQQELNSILGANSTSSLSPTNSDSKAVGIGLAIAAALALGLVVGLVLKSKQKVKKT